MKCTSIIKPSIILSILLFWQSLFSVTSPGENIWHMVRDVGLQTDTIASFAASLSNTCIHLITSATLSAGTYTISQPGLYCLSENATSTSNPMITINTSNVVLDLRNHTLTGNSLNDGVITNATAKNHVAICNGALRNCRDALSIADNINTLLIENIHAYSPAQYGITTPSVTASLTNVFIKKCHVIMGGSTSIGILLQSNGAQNNNMVISDCYINSSLSSGYAISFAGIKNACILDSIVDSGFIQLDSGSNLLTKNLIICGGFCFYGDINSGAIVDSFTNGDPSGFLVGAGTNILLERCVVVHSPANSGILFGNTPNPTVRECISLYNNQGFFESFPPVNPEYYANLAYANTTNYASPSVIPVASPPTTSTVYWTNVAG